ncbi:hypothetical protein ABKN59_009070 [Abortiporus biennis]
MSSPTIPPAVVYSSSNRSERHVFIFDRASFPVSPTYITERFEPIHIGPTTSTTQVVIDTDIEAYLPGPKISSTLASLYYHILLPSLHCSLTSFRKLYDAIGLRNFPAAHIRAVEHVVGQSRQGHALHTPFDEFVDSHSRHWKSSMVVSGLLFSAVTACLQISGFTSSMITRTLGISCMICVLESVIMISALHYFILHFPRDQADEWAKDAATLSSSKWRSVPHILASSTAWLAWAFIIFLVFLVLSAWFPVGGGVGDQTGEFVSPIPLTLLLVLATAHNTVCLCTFYRIGHC